MIPVLIVVIFIRLMDSLKSVDEMCKKLLVNLIIEDYEINKL